MILGWTWEGGLQILVEDIQNVQINFDYINSGNKSVNNYIYNVILSISPIKLVEVGEKVVKIWYTLVKKLWKFPLFGRSWWKSREIFYVTFSTSLLRIFYQTDLRGSDVEKVTSLSPKVT